MPRIMTMSFEVSDQEYATFMERVGARANPTGLQASTAVPHGAGAGAISGNGGAQVESDEAEDDDQPTAVAPAGADVDVNGVPHNPAVHASTKGKTAEGLWKRLKGVSKEAYDAFAAPYLAAKSAPASAAPSAPAASAIAVPPLPGAVPSAVPGFPPIALPVEQPVTYEALIAKFGSLTAQGKSVDNAIIMPIYQRIGLTDVNQLQTNETLRAALMKELNQLG